MPNDIPFVQTDDLYPQKKWGYYGELGEGDNAKIRFLQTVISHEELEDITLISNIPGSDKWEVRDLFQRDVDGKRVEEEIMPYLKDKSKVKFFNPLTLIILPMEDGGRDVLKEIEHIDPKDEEQGSSVYEVYEKEGYYKFGILKTNPVFAKVEWSDKKCFVVAIDGQHRLSALKRWKREPAATRELDSWKIPVVILNIFKVDKDKSTSSLLEIVRKTFVYINTQAVRVNRAREILLDDESVNAICTQELIQLSHENDCKSEEDRDESLLPLIFFDWRGETQKGRAVPAPASLKGIEEIYNWFKNYILDEDGGKKQQVQLELTDLVPPLQSFGPGKGLTHEDAGRIRKQTNLTILPGFLFLLQNFIPYKDYIESCRAIEKEALNKSDVAQYAFSKLRFGSHNAPEELIDDVHVEYGNIIDKLEELKNKLPEIISRDIGMRGLIFAFGEGKSAYEEIGNDSGWLDYTKWIIDEINEIYNEGWFESFNNLDKKKRKYLTHIIFDESGSIINYKIEKAEYALGALLIILLLNKKYQSNDLDEEIFSEVWNNYSDNLRKTIELGFRKSFRARLRDSFVGSISEFNAEVRKKSAAATKKRLTEISKYLNINI